MSRLKIEDARSKASAKVAVLGAGFTRLTTAYKLAKAGHQVCVFEKESRAGGLARGFKLPGWNWYLEENYHHLFASDTEAIELIKEVGLADKLFFKKPVTEVYYQSQEHKNTRTQEQKFPAVILKLSAVILKLSAVILNLIQNLYRPQIKFGMTKKRKLFNNPRSIFPLDTPLNFLSFPHLSFIDKMRAGAALGYLKFTPSWQHLERITAKQWILKYMGRRVWKILWEPLFINKFGKSGDKVPASWFWARIKKRSQKLGYIKGGFQVLADELVEEIKKLGGEVRFNSEIKKITRLRLNKTQKFSLQVKNLLRDRVTNFYFEKVVVGLPTTVFLEIISDLYPPVQSASKSESQIPKWLDIAHHPEPTEGQVRSDFSNYVKRLRKVTNLSALTLILILKKPFFEKTYWLNICGRDFPFLLLVDHTNFIKPRHYAGNHILYIGNYLPNNHSYLKKSKEELLKLFLPHLKRINPSFRVTSYKLQVTRFLSSSAQPVFPLDYSQIKAGLTTPIPNLFLANQDQIYPWDRGINYAIELGKRVANLICIK